MFYLFAEIRSLVRDACAHLVGDLPPPAEAAASRVVSERGQRGPGPRSAQAPQPPVRISS